MYFAIVNVYSIVVLFFFFKQKTAEEMLRGFGGWEKVIKERPHPGRQRKAPSREKKKKKKKKKKKSLFNQIQTGLLYKFHNAHKKKKVNLGDLYHTTHKNC